MGMPEVEGFLGVAAGVVGSWYICRRIVEDGDGTVDWF